MRYQPINPNTGHPNRHTLYLAASGGGKSQALSQNPALPKQGARVILWDGSGDHAGLHFTEKRAFLRALSVGVRENWLRGRGFRIAYAGPADPDEFEWFMEVCWGILDGNFQTYIVAEELSAVCSSTGKATPNAAIFMNQARKFGGIFHGTSQKPQEVSKTYFDQCAIKFIGQQSGLAMRRRMAAEIGVTPDEIAALKPLEFLRHDGSAKKPEHLRLDYRPVNGVLWQ
jgi:hypothetical protein